MRVKLIKMTQNPIDVMWTAARTCYAAKSPNDMWEDCECSFNILDTEKRWKLVKAVLNSGHQSVAEHVNFTFAIEGISRACSHQLVRHRAGIVFSQQSQRYVEIKEDLNRLKDILLILTPGSDYNLEEMGRAEEEVIPILNKYFVEVNDTNVYAYLQSLINYLSAINMGTKAEDARNFLPNATKTNITMTVNFRELIHLCNLRLCTRAQLEIRNLFREIAKCVKAQNENLATYLVPQCEVLGLCTEKNCCGRKPTLNEVMDVYNKHKELEKQVTKFLKEQEEKGIIEKCDVVDDTISTADMIRLQIAFDNPQYNKKLAQLLQQESVFEKDQ